LLRFENVLPRVERRESGAGQRAFEDELRLLAGRDLDRLVEAPAIIILIEDANRGT
jgi:hypothetical protein